MRFFKAVIFSSLFFLLGCNEGPMSSGSFKVNHEMKVKFNSIKVTYKPGTYPVSDISIDSSFFSDSTAEMKVNGRLREVILPRKYYKLNPKSFVISAQELGQEFSIEGKVSSRVVKQISKSVDKNCSYSGMCIGTSLDANGNMVQEMSMNSNCSGSMKVRRSFKVVENIYKLRLIGLGNEELASLDGKSQSRELQNKEIEDEELTDCR